MDRRWWYLSPAASMKKLLAFISLVNLLSCGGTRDDSAPDAGSGGAVDGGHFVAGSGGAVGSGGTSGPCTSGKTWTGGNGPDMAPGYDCLACHSFPAAGTIFPTAHEVNNCDGTAANGLKVVITGADGKVVTITPSPTSGDFYADTAISFPFTAKVTDASGGVRAMMASQMVGNCNACHTVAGANGAPGRIMAP